VAVNSVPDIYSSSRPSSERRTKLLGRVRALDTKLRATLRRLSQLEERLDELCMDFSELATELEATLPAGASPSSRPTASKAGDKVLRALAEQGAHSLTIRRSLNGAADVEVDGAKPFHIAAQLAALLQVLATDTDPGSGELVDWKDKIEIAHQMRTRTGEALDPGYVKKIVHKLRQEFHRNGANRYLIQSHPRHGYRFALRRSGRGLSEVTPGDRKFF